MQYCLLKHFLLIHHFAGALPRIPRGGKFSASKKNNQKNQALISALYLSVIFFSHRLATQWLITSPHRLQCLPLKFPAAYFKKKTAGYNGPALRSFFIFFPRPDLTSEGIENLSFKPIPKSACRLETESFQSF